MLASPVKPELQEQRGRWLIGEQLANSPQESGKSQGFKHWRFMQDLSWGQFESYRHPSIEKNSKLSFI